MERPIHSWPHRKRIQILQETKPYGFALHRVSGPHVSHGGIQIKKMRIGIRHHCPANAKEPGG